MNDFHTQAKLSPVKIPHLAVTDLNPTLLFTIACAEQAMTFFAPGFTAIRNPAYKFGANM